MGLFSRSKKKDKKAAGGDPPEGPSSSAPGDPTSSSGNNDLTAAVLALSSADPDGCCEAANVLRAEADRGRVPASPAIKSGAVAALLSLVRGPGGGQSSSSAGAPPSGQRGVAALSARGGRATPRVARARCRQVRAPRRERPRGHRVGGPGGATRAHARPVPPRRPPDPRAESRASSAAARGAAAGALFRLAGEPLAKSAIASRPDAVAGLVSLMCTDPGVRDPKKPGDLSGSTPSGIRRIRRDSSGGGGGSRGRVVDRHRARRRSERARGRQRFSQRGIHARRRTQRGGQRV